MEQMEHRCGRILDVVGQCIGKGDIKNSYIYWYDKVIRQGTAIKTGLQSVEMPFDGTMVFVDLAPGSNWAHPCMYLFISPENKIKTFRSFFPPSIDDTDKHYLLIMKRGVPQV